VSLIVKLNIKLEAPSGQGSDEEDLLRKDIGIARPNHTEDNDREDYTMGTRRSGKG